MSNLEFPAYPIIAIFAAVAVLIPLPWHLQAWNAGTCLFMIWTAIGCLNVGVNGIVWHSDAIDRAPIWCDISSRIIVAVAVAIPAASLCINRRLYKIASVKSATVSRAQKRRGVVIDLSIALGIPILQLIMEYIVSGHRYDIFEGIGCYPFIYNTPLAYPFVIVWPVVIGLVSAVYCVLTLRAFLRRRAEFHEYLSASSSLTANRYFRLMALATADLMCTTPIATYGMFLNITNSQIHPWISFADTHFDYSHVGQYVAIVWMTSRDSIISFELSRWSLIFCAFLFFAFFGFADEARRNYRRMLLSITALYRRWLPHTMNKSQTKSAGSLPVYMPRPPHMLQRGTVGSTIDEDDKSDYTLGQEPPTPHKLYLSECSSPSLSAHSMSTHGSAA